MILSDVASLMVAVIAACLVLTCLTILGRQLDRTMRVNALRIEAQRLHRNHVERLKELNAKNAAR